MPASPAPTGILIGRDEALSAIEQALDGAAGGQGSVVMIGGGAGIGKTRLADHVARVAAARGMRTAWGRAAGGSGAPVYWLWTQVLRSALRDRTPDAITDGLDSHAEPLRTLLPELDTVPGPPPVDAASTPDQARFRLFQSATDCLRRLTELPDRPRAAGWDAIDGASAGRGLLVVLDDIDQADDASLGLLTFAAHAIDATAIVILCTFREESVSQRPVLRETLAELARARAARRLTLGPLRAGDVGALLEHLLGMPCPPALVAALHDHTGGNPFFLTEVARALAGCPIDAGLGALPAVVREVVRIRIERLTPDCGPALAAAAVLGREFDVPVLGRVSGLSIDVLLEALEEAERAHIIAAVESEPGRFRFEHAIIRDTLYEVLPAARRVRLHRAAGEAIEAHCTARLEPHAPSLAHHFFQAMPAGGAPRALRYAEQAADHAASVYAYSEAARLYDIALRALAVEAPHDDARRFDLLVAAGRTFERAGLHDSGRERLLEAADLTRRLDSPHRLAQVVLAFDRRVLIDPEIHSLVQEVLRRVPATDRMLRLRLLTQGVGVLPFSPQYVATLNESVALAREMDDPVSAAIGLESRYRAGWHFDSLAERLRAGSELLAAARAAGEHEIEFLALWGRAYDLLEAGDRCALDDTVNALQAIAQHTQQARHLWIEAGVRAAIAILDGRLDDA
ncbi:MAG: ATP-binding protein, partial [Dehalococcoidia bacterium]